MGRFALCSLVCAALTIAGAGLATAEVPSVVAVQGRLTDNVGLPLPAGDKSFTFRIYDLQAAGNKVWPASAGEIQPITTSIEGSWSALVGTVEPLSESVFADPERWLEIEVDGTILPRMRLATGPFAFRVATIDGAEGGLLNSALQTPGLEVGSSLQSGLVQLFQNGSTAPAAVFDMAQTGDNSVTLPPDAIANAELLDEPGVASNDRHAEFILTGGVDWLTSRTMTAPADGYVLVIATGEVILVHANGTSSSGMFGLSDNSAAFLAVQNITQIPSAAPTGTYKVALAAQTIIPVTPGAHTFYLLGNEVSGNLRASDLELSLLFVPTAYGTVDPLAASEGPTDPDTVPEPGIEHAQAGMSNSAQIQQELAAMRAELETLKAQMAEQRELNQSSAALRR